MARFPFLIAVFVFLALLLGCPTEETDDDVSDDDVSDDDVSDDDVSDDDVVDDDSGDDDTATGDDMDGDGYSPDQGDCDDENPDVNPGADEVPYDGVDNDCAGGDLMDADGDGYDTAWFEGDDCDDGDADVHPGATEVCGDEVDQDCTGDPNDGITDADSDGFIDWECTDGDDCDDSDSDIVPLMEVYVPDDFADVVTAVDAVCNGSTVYVDEGSYYGSIDAAGKSINIVGTGAAAATFLLGDGAATTVVVGGGGLPSTLSNLTVRDGIGTWGGGVYCTGECSFDFVIFAENEAYFGGGLALVDSDLFAVTSCTFETNNSSWGGGIYVENSTGSIADSTFVGNVTTSGGGGISGWFTEMEMSDLTVMGNVGDQGGGLHLYTCTSTLADSSITDNEAQTAGGMQTRDGSLDMTNTNISYNYGTWGGGGYYCWDSTVTSIETNTIENNQIYDCDDYVMYNCTDLACRTCTGC